MENKKEVSKYYIKSNSGIIIGGRVSSIIFLILFMLFLIFLIIANVPIIFYYIITFFILIAVCFVILSFFIMHKIYYLKLDNESIKFNICYRIISPFTYKIITKISISNDSLHIYYPHAYPLLVSLKDQNKFIKDLSLRYKKATGKNLKVIRE
ncbi:DUF2207 domain-containing protein [Candidatus Pacearchaeota archaeon]|nr:DUF2207 domain-containing protein [Candidatus Pacearchaeota archaeon]